jgi:thiamine biosynthesis lipoprotein
LPPTIFPPPHPPLNPPPWVPIGGGDEVLTVSMVAGAVGGWGGVRIDRHGLRAYLPEGMRIDLGGIAKGYTAGQAVDLLGRLGPCLVDAGGDLAAGAAPTGMPGWPVSLTTPWAGEGDSPQHLLMVWLREASIATSGIDWRRWEHQGRTVHHLIDPRSGAPAETDALTATVLDPDPARAEGWATAALVLGMAGGLAVLSMRGLAGALVDGYRRVALTPEMQIHMAWQAA